MDVKAVDTHVINSADIHVKCYVIHVSYMK